LLCLALACVATIWAGSAALAQRYPPFPIGGSSASGTGTGTGNNGTNQRDTVFPGGGDRASSRSSGAGGSSSASGVGGATTSGSTRDVARCLLSAGRIGDAFVPSKVEEGGVLRVGGYSGCAGSRGRVDVSMESTRVLLGTVTANADGSYFGQFTVPAAIKAGAHHVVADIQGCCVLRAPILVVAQGSGVLGTATSDTRSSGGGGILPKTGGEIARLVLWAMLLLALGTSLVMGARNATRRLAPANARGGPRERRGAVPLLPSPEVPFIDTSRFVPYRSTVTSSDTTRTSARPSPPARRVDTNAIRERWGIPKNESQS